MGEPATPTKEQRKETRALASRIVESVRADEPMAHELRVVVGVRLDHGPRIFNTRDVEDLVFKLAQEIELLVEDYHRGEHL